MNALDQTIPSHIHAPKENYKSVFPWFKELKAEGLNPRFFTLDGEKTVIRAIKETWPHAQIQRCLYHIQREGMRWLRSYPKTQAGRDLRFLLSKVCSIKSVKERDHWIDRFKQWFSKHKDFIKQLPSSDIGFRDLKKTVSLIKYALPDMFHYLKEPAIPSTTNALEGFYSRLKAYYNRHRGLTQIHKIYYLKWYCFLKNNNTF